MVKQLLKALDAGFTAFCNELWLPTFGFHLFDDPADALEVECDGGCCRHEPDVPVELAGSLSAPGDGPPAAQSTEAAAGGHPNQLSNSEIALNLIAAVTGYGHDDKEAHRDTSEIVFKWICDPDWFGELSPGTTVKEALEALK